MSSPFHKYFLVHELLKTFSRYVAVKTEREAFIVAGVATATTISFGCLQTKVLWVWVFLQQKSKV